MQLGGSGVLAAGLGAAGAPAGLVSSPSAPSHLRRSSYLLLTDRRFSVRRVGAPALRLRLVAVEDLPGERRVRGTAEDAFALRFRAAHGAALPQGTHRLHHPVLGSFDLMLVPGRGGRYHRAVVDRREALGA